MSNLAVSWICSMDNSTPQLKYRIACAREALEKAALSVMATANWLEKINSEHQADMRYEAELLQDIMKQMVLLDMKLADQA